MVGRRAEAARASRESRTRDGERAQRRKFSLTVMDPRGCHLSEKQITFPTRFRIDRLSSTCHEGGVGVGNGSLRRPALRSIYVKLCINNGCLRGHWKPFCKPPKQHLLLNLRSHDRGVLVFDLHLRLWYYPRSGGNSPANEEKGVKLRRHQGRASG